MPREGDVAFTTVTVTVPEEYVSDVLRYAADLAEPDDEVEQLERRRGTPHGYGREAVRGAYLGGSSDTWRPWLEHLAANADRWLPQADIANAIGMDPTSVPGMLGAAERRCKQRPPYEKRWVQGRREFLMPTSVARVILELAE
jgi:hypothetical protein